MRGAFWFAVLARARADRVGGGGSVCTAGAGLWRILGKPGFFRVLGNSEKVAPGAGSSYPVSNSAPSRARATKNIPAGPDGSGGPPEPSETARIMSGVRLRNAAELLSQRSASFVAKLLSDFWPNAKTQVFPKIRQRPPPAVHTERPPRSPHTLPRARNAKQNAPRARGWSNWRCVVRFASRFSRARVRTASAAGGPHVQRGEAFGGFSGNLGFRVFGKF